MKKDLDYRRRIPEVFEQCPVEAVKDDEVGFVRILLPFSRPAPEHLLKENSGFYGTQENDVFEIRNVDAG